MTDPAAGIDVPNSNDTLTLAGLVTGTGGLTKTGAGDLALTNAAGNDYSGDTNVLAGTLLAQADNALSPNSNLVIGDGASVVLDFGGGGSGTRLPGIGAPLPVPGIGGAVAPAPAGISTVPEPGTWTLLLAGVISGFGCGIAGGNRHVNARSMQNFYPQPPHSARSLNWLPWQAEA